jgi:hypothetical protein
MRILSASMVICMPEEFVSKTCEMELQRSFQVCLWGVVGKILPNGQRKLQINISKPLLLTLSNNSTNSAATEIPLQSHAFAQLQPELNKFAIKVDKLVTIVVPAGLMLVKTVACYARQRRPPVSSPSTTSVLVRTFTVDGFSFTVNCSLLLVSTAIYPRRWHTYMPT